jgi:hypothetical protein
MSRGRRRTVRTPGIRPHDTAAKRSVSRLNSLKQVTTHFLQRLHTHFIGHKRRSAHATTSPLMSAPTRFRCAIPKTSSCEQPTSRLNQSSRRSTRRWRLHSSCPPEDSLIPAGTRHTTFPARFLAQNAATPSLCSDLCWTRTCAPTHAPATPTTTRRTRMIRPRTRTRARTRVVLAGQAWNAAAPTFSLRLHLDLHNGPERTHARHHRSQQHTHTPTRWTQTPDQTRALATTQLDTTHALDTLSTCDNELASDSACTHTRPDPWCGLFQHREHTQPVPSTQAKSDFCTHAARTNNKRRRRWALDQGKNEFDS